MGVLSLMTLAPLAMAGILLLIPSVSKGLMRLLSLVAALVVLGSAIYIAIMYQPAFGGIQFREYTALVPSLGIAWKLGIDGWGIALIFLTSLLSIACVFSAWTLEDRAKEFYVVLLCMISGLVGVFVSLDLLVFFIVYQMAVLPMYLLNGVWGSNTPVQSAGPFSNIWNRFKVGHRTYSAMKMALFMSIGSALILIVFLGMVSEAGGRNWDLEYLQAYAYSTDFQIWAFPILWIGFALLSGLFPFHTWCVDAQTNAPTASSILHAGVLMKLGAFGLIRIGMICLPEGAAEWIYPIGCLAVLNVLWGALAALAQKELKSMIAYASVSHMGLALLGAASMTQAGWNGAIFHMVGHGLTIGLLFAVVGLFYRRTEERDMAKMGGWARELPIIAFFFTLAVSAVLALPGTAVFVSELQVLLGVYESRNAWWIVPALCGTLLATVYLIRSAHSVFWGTPLLEPDNPQSDVRGSEWVALCVLGASIIALGLYPQLLMKYIDPTTTPFLTKLVPFILEGAH